MSGTRGDEVRKHDRRFAAVVAVFGEPGLDLLDPSQQRLHLRPQGGVGRPQRGFLGFHLCDTALCCAHATRLHLHRKSAGTVPPLCS
jgi:hypothetical protein